MSPQSYSLFFTLKTFEQHLLKNPLAKFCREGILLAGFGFWDSALGAVAIVGSVCF